jgi:hypothetical protein
LPLRPFRGSGKAAHTAFKSARRDGKSLIPMVNHFSSDLGILKSGSPPLLELLASLPQPGLLHDTVI